ncbi:hypothetical protein DRO64_00165 [Candidatus Bathyarchaeota archaeon]|nr:MAG: hypothetical protein DRO64_00165 [Candidatus Bathyarchaeota archaeon]
MGSDKLLRAIVAILVILILFTGLFVILKQQVIPVMEQYQNLKHSYERLKEEYSSLFKPNRPHILRTCCSVSGNPIVVYT